MEVTGHPSLTLDWSELAFASKRPVNQLGATFIAAPRELSSRRFNQLIKEYLPRGNILLGLAKEDYVDGLSDQPQFAMLRAESVAATIRRVNQATATYKIYTISYFQRETKYLLEKLDFARAVFVNGSWHQSFHTLAPYYVLATRHTPYTLVTPFCDEAEARAFEAGVSDGARTNFEHSWSTSVERQIRSEHDLLAIASDAAKLSYDHTYQTGVALARPFQLDPGSYQLVSYAYNRIVPYQTYAMHHGASRERHFSPPGDLNHYDTIHAEVALVLEAGRLGLDLHGTSLFINLMPCPSCARMLAQTNIAEYVYELDHSDGYAARHFEQAGKLVRRITSPPEAS